VANGQANVGFGTTTSGTLSAVLNAASKQFSIQNNRGFTATTTLASAKQSFSANQWYRVEIAWGTSGKVVAKLFSSTGTLLNSVTAATGDKASGWFAFRATGSTKYFDTVTDTHGANNFALPASPDTPATQKQESLANVRVVPVGNETALPPTQSTPATTPKAEDFTLRLPAAEQFDDWGVWQV
jgi:hypothetical protein